jgi:hypothetical protein
MAGDYYGLEWPLGPSCCLPFARLKRVVFVCMHHTFNIARAYTMIIGGRLFAPVQMTGNDKLITALVHPPGASGAILNISI